LKGTIGGCDFYTHKFSTHLVIRRKKAVKCEHYKAQARDGGKFEKPTTIGKANEVVGQAKLSTKPPLLLCDPVTFTLTGLGELLGDGISKGEN
jgi:hypothetical protein